MYSHRWRQGLHLGKVPQGNLENEQSTLAHAICVLGSLLSLACSPVTKNYLPVAM